MRRLILVILCLAAFACGKDEPNAGSLFVQVVGNGRVTDTNGDLNCPGDCRLEPVEGTEVTLQAVPDPGWSFTRWLGDCTGNSDCVVVVGPDSAVTAEFETPTFFTLDVIPIGLGEPNVMSDPAGVDCGTTCSADFEAASNVALTAFGEFQGWYGLCSGRADCDVNMLSDQRLGAAFAASGEAIELLNYQAPNSDSARAIAFDSSGNSAIAGTFGGTIDIGGVMLPSAAADREGYVARRGFDGSVFWARLIGGDGNEEPNAVAIDSTGSVLVGGEFCDTTTIGGFVLTSQYTSGCEGFVAKYSAIGDAQWAVRLGGPTGRAFVTDIAVRPDDTLVVGGYVEGSFTALGNTFTALGDQGGLLLSMASDSTYDWSTVVGDNQAGSYVQIRSIAFDGPDLVVGADFTNSPFIAVGCCASAGLQDGFVAKFDGSNSAGLWGHEIGGTEMDYVRDVATVGGEVFATGEFQGMSAGLGGGANVSSAGANDIFLSQFSGAGAYVQSFRYGDVDADLGMGIVAHGDGTVTLSGLLFGTATYGGTTLTSLGATFDGIVLKVDLSTGAVIAAQRFGSIFQEFIWETEADANGNVAIVGDFAGSADFGNDTLTASGGDSFLFRVGR